MNRIGYKLVLMGSMMVLSVVQPAFASLSFSTSNTQVLAPTISLNAATLGNLPNLYTTGIATFYLGDTPTGQGIVQGSVSGQYAAPYLVPSGPQTGDNYISTGDKNPHTGTVPADIIITLSSPQSFFSFLWGSVDTYNTLKFFNSPSPGQTSVPLTAVFTIVGQDVITSAVLNAGNQGSQGSTYVTVSGGLFNQIEFLSTQNSFEAANFAFTPEPAFYGLMGVGLAGLFAVVRRRKA